MPKEYLFEQSKKGSFLERRHMCEASTEASPWQGFKFIQLEGDKLGMDSVTKRLSIALKQGAGSSLHKDTDWKSSKMELAVTSKALIFCINDQKHQWQGQKKREK